MRGSALKAVESTENGRKHRRDDSSRSESPISARQDRKRRPGQKRKLTRQEREDLDEDMAVLARSRMAYLPLRSSFIID